MPKGNKPDAIIMCLPGNGEMGEKYFEAAKNFIDHNLGMHVIDWYGQGGSGRFLNNPQKRHSGPFEEYISDLNHYITRYIQSDKNIKNVPLVMLAHSMGGNIGLRYLHQYPNIFATAIFTAPMIGIHAAEFLPAGMRSSISRFLNKAASENYVMGGSDWNFHKQDLSKFILSSDPVRSNVTNQWLLKNPVLQVGNVTYGWVHHALESCAVLYNKETLGAIQTHCLIAIAENEALVDNNAIYKATALMPHAKLLELEGAQHEILMEKDKIRELFLESFYKHIKENTKKSS